MLRAFSLPIFLTLITPTFTGAADREFREWRYCFLRSVFEGQIQDDAFVACADQEVNFVIAVQGAYPTEKAAMVHDIARRVLHSPPGASRSCFWNEGPRT